MYRIATGVPVPPQMAEEGADDAGTEGADAAGTEGADDAGTEGADAAGTEGADAAGTEGAGLAQDMPVDEAQPVGRAWMRRSTARSGGRPSNRSQSASLGSTTNRTAVDLSSALGDGGWGELLRFEGGVWTAKRRAREARGGGARQILDRKVADRPLQERPRRLAADRQRLREAARPAACTPPVHLDGQAARRRRAAAHAGVDREGVRLVGAAQGQGEAGHVRRLRQGGGRGGPFAPARAEPRGNVSSWRG